MLNLLTTTVEPWAVIFHNFHEMWDTPLRKCETHPSNIEGWACMAARAGEEFASLVLSTCKVSVTQDIQFSWRVGTA
jgi:hypothetical protein